MKGKTLLIFLLISLGINVGLGIWIARSKFYAKNKCPACTSQTCNWRQSPLCQDLGLTDKQVQQLEKLNQNLQQVIKPGQSGLQIKRAELMVLLKSATVGDEKLKILLGEISQAQSTIERHYIEHYLQVKSVLLPQQQKKMTFYLEQGLCGNILGGYSGGCQEAAACPGKKCPLSPESQIIKKGDITK